MNTHEQPDVFFGSQSPQLLRTAMWVEAFLVFVITLGSGVLARVAEVFVLRIRTDQIEGIMLPPFSKIFFTTMPDTVFGIFVVAVACGGLTFWVNYVFTKNSSSPLLGLLKFHIISMLLNGLFCGWLILLFLCTLLPLIPWP